MHHIEGLQFKANFLKATQPTTREGIEKYLGSSMIWGLGPVYARKLVQAFGEAVFDIIAAEPDRLREMKRLSESTKIEAKTIYRLLEADLRNGGFKRDEANLPSCGLLVMDETSMVDVPLMLALLRALPDSAALLLVGDVDQLPLVGPGLVACTGLNA